MTNDVPPNYTRAARPARLAATALALAAGIAGAGSVAAGQADAAPSQHSYRHHAVGFPRAGLRHGRLTITGTRASDTIALRLKAGRPSILQVDVGDDGSPDFSVKRRFISRIDVDGRAGDDSVRID